MKNKLMANLGLKIISLLFSFMLWLVVNNMNDPTIDRSFSNIPVKLLNTELITDSGQVYEVLDDTAVIDRVTIWAPRSVFSSLTASNIVATADVSELSSLDTISIKLTTNLSSGDIEKIKASSDTVKLHIENKKTKTLALEVTTSGTTKSEYMIGEISTDQNLVRISGPESVISKVSRAVVDVPVTGFTSDISDNAEIRLYDAEGDLIQDSRIVQNIKTVGIKVVIYKIAEIPIIFNYMGEPADGYEINGDVQGSISSVKLAGKENILKNVTAIEIPAEEIDISDRREDYQGTIKLEKYLPAGTFLPDTSERNVEVTVKIDPQITKELVISGERVAVIGIPDGYRATISELDSSITIQVKGLSEDVAGLRASELRGTVDVTKWMESEGTTEPAAGYYQVEVDFGLPEGVTVEDPLIVTMHLSKVEE